MKSFYIASIFFALLPALFLSGCKSQSVESKSSSAGDKMLVTEELPKGIEVIDDVIGSSVDPVNVTMMGNADDKTSGSDKNNPVVFDKQDYYKRKFKSLLVFHADDSMVVNAPRLATLVLAKGQTIDKLKLEVLEESNAKDDRITTDTAIEFGSKMKAKLIPFSESAETTFEIEALGDDIQSFTGEREKILWQWKITPLKAGKQELKLSVQIVEKDGEAVMLPAKNIVVEIYAKNESILQKVGGFIEKKWEFLLTAILIPVIIAWFTTKIKHKNNGQRSVSTREREG